MNAYHILVIILSIALIIFLVLAMVAAGMMIALLMEAKKVAKKAENTAENIEAFSNTLKSVATPIAFVKILTSIFNLKKSKKK